MSREGGTWSKIKHNALGRTGQEWPTEDKSRPIRVLLLPVCLFVCKENVLTPLDRF